MNFLDFDSHLIVSHAVRMAVAFVLAVPIAWEREQSSRSMGLRTFPLVAIASCGYMLLGSVLAGASPDAKARVLQGLLAGIGFIGGGAILKNDGNVSGTATAASIWGTGAVGAAVAFDRYEIAVLVSVLTFATLRLLTPLKRTQQDEDAS